MDFGPSFFPKLFVSWMNDKIEVVQNEHSTIGTLAHFRQVEKCTTPVGYVLEILSGTYSLQRLFLSMESLDQGDIGLIKLDRDVREKYYVKIIGKKQASFEQRTQSVRAYRGFSIKPGKVPSKRVRFLRDSCRRLSRIDE